MNLRGVLLVGTVLLFAGASYADPIPSCMKDSSFLEVNNDQVLQWKQSSPNQFKARGHIRGQISRIYKNRSGHNHFAVSIGNSPDATVEVIYNKNFGALLEPSVGMEVEACGDYITSTAPAGPYPASPDGAILHWVHRATGGRHLPGYLALDGVVYGQE